MFQLWFFSLFHTWRLHDFTCYYTVATTWITAIYHQYAHMPQWSKYECTWSTSVREQQKRVMQVGNLCSRYQSQSHMQWGDYAYMSTQHSRARALYYSEFTGAHMKRSCPGCCVCAEKTSPCPDLCQWNLREKGRIPLQMWNEWPMVANILTYEQF